MLNYCKTILSKVSFDRILFRKELRKALDMLLPSEKEELKRWCFDQFSDSHPQILIEQFC
ncbi:MAG: hypothetical protein MI784_00820 [Cytophagales bacterium]|nr:hypothetical protein [Cytophagales bacterium]